MRIIISIINIMITEKQMVRILIEIHKHFQKKKKYSLINLQ